MDKSFAITSIRARTKYAFIPFAKIVIVVLSIGGLLEFILCFSCVVAIFFVALIKCLYDTFMGSHFSGSTTLPDIPFS